ncbi:MAG TPA: Uma2 family endonuclease [Polyangiaceae bacterium]|nr:Uma2 family endonuclease [Polyangiaceae bacterium]
MSQARWPGSPPEGPFRLEHVPEGSRYELSEGHTLYCAPAGPKHGEPHGVGPVALGSDPARPRVGVDVGHALDDKTLRAPDLSVGDWGEGEGAWAPKAPPLAIEYAAQGQDEADLQTKIRELLAAGSRFVWVVRLVGPRRVEVYEKGRAAQAKRPGERLEAPGILKSRPLVEALYDPEAAFEQTLQNLLERKGYAGLEAVLAEGEARGREAGLREGEARGKAEGLREGEAKGLREGEAKGLREGEARGKAEGLRAAVLDLCEAFGVEPTAEQRGRLDAMGVAELEGLRQALKQQRRWPG